MIKVNILKSTLILLSVGLSTSLIYSQKGDPSKTTEKFERLINYVESLYVDSVDSEKLVEDAIIKVLEELDPHSAYIPHEKVSRVEEPLKGNFDGIGVRFNLYKDTIMVVEPLPGGPSMKVGIIAGDKIIKVDGEVVAGIGISNTGVANRLRGQKGTKVEVEILRKGEKKLLDFTITRDKIPINSVDAAYMVDDKIGYIKVNKFASTTHYEFLEGVEKLKSQGMQDLILDLQGNGGGYLMTAIRLADEFLSGNKMIVYTEGRAFPKQVYKSRKSGEYESGRLVVLVDKNSASASEIVSGAIQDWDRGLIVGRRTFGKGLVQKPVMLTDSSKVRLTTQRYYTPSGRCIQKSYDEGSQEYRKEKYTRGAEEFHKDSIILDSTQQFQTLINKRNVFGGGGVIPDEFVALDTNWASAYLSKLIRKGVINRYSIDYVETNRKKIERDYPTFEVFNRDFDLDDACEKLIKFAEDEEIEFDKESYLKGEKVLRARLKAQIASNLYGFDKFYQIVNEINEVYLRGVEVLKDGTYEEYNLPK